MNSQATPAIAIGKAVLFLVFYQGQPVITLAMMDQAHERPEGTARRNFNENKSKLIEGEDYFVRNSSEAKAEFGIIAPNGLTLLTESGYLMLVKSFTDDLAWAVQRKLVKGYFGYRERLALDRDDTRLVETQSHMLRLIDALKRETSPELRATLYASLESTCRVLKVPVPPLTAMGREFVPPPVHPLVVEFWALYAAIGAAALNHSADPRLIAISLKQMMRLAAERGLSAPPWGALCKVLPTSAAPRFLGYRPIHSALNARHNPVATPAERRPKTVRCWVFEALPATEARASPG